MKIRSLTRSETQVMKILWKVEKAFITDILKGIPPPKPAYTTISTVVRVLEKKQVVGHVRYGNTHQYYALVSEDEYRKHETQQLISDYFSNSANNLLCFLLANNYLETQGRTFPVCQTPNQ